MYILDQTNISDTLRNLHPFIFNQVKNIMLRLKVLTTRFINYSVNDEHYLALVQD